MSLAVETFGFFMGALGLLMLGVTLSHSSWRVSTVHGNVITTNTIFENLWFSCATDSMGVYNCREFPSLLALSGIVGLRCINIGSMELSRKAKLAATAGALHILAGLGLERGPLLPPQVSVGWWPSPGMPSTSPRNSLTPCILGPSTSWAPPSTWAGAPPCSPSWGASASAPAAAALLMRTGPPGSPTRPPQCGPPSSLTACAPRPRTKGTAPLANTGRTPTCRTQMDPIPLPMPQRRKAP
ncbi:claudin-15 isoform X2 [Lutra lutra]|uniref:claudin-15 isoform X2 n=1 Tax=Lutra lutra TaxID=9657 RepID=UPI001FD4B15D|nr:claudin-15 isoform X2 [Lutra lutra]